MQVTGLDNNIPRTIKNLQKVLWAAKWSVSTVVLIKNWVGKIHFKKITILYPICINSNILYTNFYNSLG